MPLSHFDEKSGVIPWKTPWGRWWQTLEEVFVEVDLPEGTKGKDIRVVAKPSYIECALQGQVVFKGNLFSTIHAEDMTWSIQDRKLLQIVMEKADSSYKDQSWDSLLLGQYQPDPWTLHQMRQKHDLEKFQIENPEFDFSNAKLSKCYDNIPGVGEVLSDGALDKVSSSVNKTDDEKLEAGLGQQEKEELTTDDEKSTKLSGTS